MGQTAGGLPWPAGTDLVRDGDNAIRALAEAVDIRGGGFHILGGGVQVSPSVNGNFSFLWKQAGPGILPFSQQPWCAVTPGTSVPNGMLVVAIADPLAVDTAGFTGVVMSIAPGRDPLPHTTPFFLTYIAIGVL